MCSAYWRARPEVPKKKAQKFTENAVLAIFFIDISTGIDKKIKQRKLAMANSFDPCKGPYWIKVSGKNVRE